MEVDTKGPGVHGTEVSDPGKARFCERQSYQFLPVSKTISQVLLFGIL